MARMQAPAGGAVVNNQYQPGGQFMPKAFRRIRAVVAAAERKKLGRPSDMKHWTPGLVEARQAAPDDAQFHADETQHLALADFLQEHDDPLEDVVRKRHVRGVLPVWHAAQAAAGGEGGADPVTTTSGHLLSNGTHLTLGRAAGAGGTHWAVGWQPHVTEEGRHATTNGAYATHMTGREFRKWLRRFDPDTIRQLVDEHNARRRPRSGSTKFKLARTKESLLSPEQIADKKEGLPTHLLTDLRGLGLDPHQHTLTKAQLLKFEDHHGLEPDSPDRLTNKKSFYVDRDTGRARTNREDLDAFYHALNKRRLAGHDLEKVLSDPNGDPELKAVHLINHMHADSAAYSDFSGNKPDTWYGEAINHLEKAFRKVYGWKKRKKGEPHWKDPHTVLMKAVMAASSGGMLPVRNAEATDKIIRDAVSRATIAGHHPDRWLEHVSPVNQQKYEQWLDAHPTAKGDPLSPTATIDQKLKWVLKHHPDADADNVGFKGIPVRYVAEKGPDYGKVIAILKGKSKWKVLPRRGRLDATYRGRRSAEGVVPAVDKATGAVRAKGWTYRPSLEEALDGLKAIHKNLGNDMEATARWLLEAHNDEGFTKAQGKPLTKNQRGYVDEPTVPGSFFMGPKFGPFFLNLHANEPDTKHEYGRYLTPDMWFARYWFHVADDMFNRRGKIKEQPGSTGNRRKMWRAVRRAADIAGTTVADLQANLWYYRQHLDRLFGADAESQSYADAAKKVLENNGKR